MKKIAKLFNAIYNEKRIIYAEKNKYKTDLLLSVCFWLILAQSCVSFFYFFFRRGSCAAYLLRKYRKYY